jgi:uncharacterized membrane protein
MMKQFLIAAALAAFALVPSACKQSSEGGSPGTSSNFKFERDGTNALELSLKPGEVKTVEVKLKRGSDFHRGVKVSVKGTDKVSADVSPDVAKENESPTFMVKISAKADAVDGEHQVVLTGTPDGGGNATTDTIKVNVKK